MDNKFDLKQIGGGAGATALIMFLLQSQGVSLINKNQDAVNQIAIEKTVANTARIEKNEKALTAINTKIDNGFESLRVQVREQKDYIVQLVQSQVSDRYTKTEHTSFSESVRDRFKMLERQVLKMEAKIETIQDKK